MSASVLDVDFGAPAPQVVTALMLAAGDGEEPELWALPVPARRARLLTLIGERPLSAQLRCAGCGEPIEIDLAVPELLAIAAAAPDGAPDLDFEGETVRLRLPT